ncbi:unnamed protein product [Lactuca virosa]|uniref:Uncharacterized protein n=1 Tax=Lactuca virosa TaxID=75947 RepID=A0AAU9PGP0_9ASTR|nr:unnamed protein product [Lactuca virosa]
MEALPITLKQMVGNTEAATLLIKNDRRLLEIPDHKGETPLDKAYQNMHLDTIDFLLKAVYDDIKPKKQSSTLEDSVSPGVKLGVNLLVNVVSAKKYEFAVENDNVLLAIAKTFPMGLDYWETLIYPIMGDICERIVKRGKDSFTIFVDFYEGMMCLIEDIPDEVIFVCGQMLLFMTLMGEPLIYNLLI